MAEGKAQLTNRLRREGRVDEGMAWKDAKVRELVASGVKRADAKELAWVALAQEFPPLPETIAAAAAKAAEKEAKVKAKAEKAVDAEPTLPIVKEDAFPWDDLPAKADPKVEADWIYANYKRVVIENASGKALIHWGEALTPPPSEGTRTLLKYAVGNFHGFIKDVWMKFNLSSDDVSEDENVRREKTSIAEIKRILSELKGPADG